MRNLFRALLVFASLGFFIYKLPKPVNNAQPANLTTVTQWFPQLATTPAPAPVWVAPVNPQYPSEWTTTDGQKFSKVKVMVMEADAVTIMHSNGVAVVDLAVLPADLQRTFNYIPSSAQVAAAKRTSGEKNSDQNWNQDQQVTALLTVGDVGTYMISQEENNRLIPYHDKLQKSRTQINGHISDLNASSQKVEADRAALDHSDPAAVERFNAEVKQFNDYKEWVDQEINDFNSQVIAYDGELRTYGKKTTP